MNCGLVRKRIPACISVLSWYLVGGTEEDLEESVWINGPHGPFVLYVSSVGVN
jgi:hypothetical protein